jgi:hypothetical protein
VETGFVNHAGLIGLIESLEKSLNSTITYVGQELHKWDFKVAEKFKEFYLIVDSYIPPNYSYSYHDMYNSNIIFNVLENFNKIFYLKNYLNVKNTFSFLTPNYHLFVPKKTAFLCEYKFTVVVLLQSSSEWTSLVNRSDSINLVNYFIKLSKKYNQIKFVIRPHPSMNIYLHDGESSITRIATCLEEINLPNIVISKNSFEIDILEGDLFITDYSSSIFSLIKFNKLWVSLNLSSRRNFFDYFKKFNFFIFNTSIDFESFFDLFISNFKRVEFTYNEALQKFKNNFENVY